MCFIEQVLKCLVLGYFVYWDECLERQIAVWGHPINQGGGIPFGISILEGPLRWIKTIRTMYRLESKP